MDNGLLCASAVSAAGLAAMGAIALLVEPPLVEFDELPRKIGATVSVEADVLQIDSRPEGWSRMRLQQDNESVEVISNAPLNLSAGDRARVTGQVGTYAGRIQISVESAADVVLLRPWRENHVPLSRLLAEPWRFAGTMLRTSGTLDDGMLTSDHGTFGVPVRGSGGRSGDVLVEAAFEYDPSLGQFHLRILRTEPIPRPS